MAFMAGLGSGAGTALAGGLIGSLFGGGEQTNPAAEAQARILNWLFKKGMKQYLPQIFGAYSSMMTNPQQDPTYQLFRQSLLREGQGAFGREIDPTIMDLSRRGVLDSSMMGQGVSDAATRVAGGQSNALAQFLANLRMQGISGLQGAVTGGAGAAANLAGGFSQPPYAQQPNMANIFNEAALAYGRTLDRSTTRNTAGGTNTGVSYGGAGLPWSPSGWSGGYM